MELLIALIASVIFASLFKRAIKTLPVLFYVLAVLIVVVFLAAQTFSIAPFITRALSPYIQRCLFAFGLFTLVMFVGVFPEDSPFRRYFMSIRGELSIIAAILALGHVVNYLNAYLQQALTGFQNAPTTMVVSFIVSVLLLVLLVILTVTSFNAVRKRMGAPIWKKIQMLAYPFFLLTYVHLALILVPSISSYDQKAFLSICLYTTIMIAYVAFRGRKWAIDNLEEKSERSRELS